MITAATVPATPGADTEGLRDCGAKGGDADVADTVGDDSRRRDSTTSLSG